MSKTNSKVKKVNKTAVNFRSTKRKAIYSVDNTPVRTPLLYRVVYQSKYSLITTFILLCSFFVQGITVTYANEDLPVTEEQVVIEQAPAEAIADAVAPLPQDEVDIAEVESDTEIVPPVGEASELNNNFTDSQTAEPEVLTDAILNENNESSTSTAEVSESEVINDDIAFEPDDDNQDTATSSEVIDPVTDDVLSDTDEVTPEVEEVEEVEVVDVESGSGDDSEITDSASSTEIELVTEVSTTTEITALEIPINITNSDTEFKFNKNECTKLATGSFYCLEAEDNLLKDALFSAPDADGDLEIYLVRSGVQSQVTSNLTDDAAPFFDQNSDSIVWHRLIEDRYQIIAYDIESGDEVILTEGTTNNMEPNRQGKYTVWQRWIDNNWDIVLFDGDTERVITESSDHDIAPYIHGTLVVWNRYGTGQDKTIEMYDMSSQTYVSVNDPEGLSVTNPRMVFVYDSLHPNGDVVTKGYDLISKKFIQLDTLPVNLPDEIPESESTGETRALIQSKPTIKSEVEEAANGTSTPKIDDFATTTPIVEGDLNLTLDLSTTSEPVVLVPVVESEMPATFDLIVEPLNIGTSSETVQE